MNVIKSEVFYADLVTFTDEILNRKLQFLCSEKSFVQGPLHHAILKLLHV